MPKFKNSVQRNLGISLSLISFLTGGVILLLYTPIVLRFLGKEQYGLYTISFSTVEYLMFIGFSVGGAYIKFFSRYKVNKDWINLRKFNAIFTIVLSIVVLIGLIIGTIVIFNLDFILNDKLSDRNLSWMQLTIAVLLINMAIDITCMIFQLFAQAKERFIFNKSIQLLKIILMPIISIIFLYLKLNILGLALGLLIANIIIGLINGYYALRHLKMSFDFNKLNFSIAKEIFIFSFYLLVVLMADLATRNMGTFIIARMINIKAAAIYGVAMKLALYFTQVSMITSSIYQPKINLLVSKKNQQENLNKLFKHIGRWQFVMLMNILCGFIIFGKPFIRLWAGPGFNNAYLMTILLMTSYLCPMIMVGGIMIQTAMNKHSFNALIFPVMMLLNISLSITFVHFYGSIGICYSAIITTTITYVIVMNIFFVKKIFLDIKAFWIEIFKIAPILIALYCVGILLSKFLDFTIISQMLFAMVIFILFTLILSYFLILTKEERTKLHHFALLAKNIAIKFLRTFSFWVD